MLHGGLEACNAGRAQHGSSIQPDMLVSRTVGEGLWKLGQIAQLHWLLQARTTIWIIIYYVHNRRTPCTCSCGSAAIALQARHQLSADQAIAPQTNSPFPVSGNMAGINALSRWLSSCRQYMFKDHRLHFFGTLTLLMIGFVFMMAFRVNLQWFWLLLYAALILPFAPYVTKPEFFYR